MAIKGVCRSGDEVRGTCLNHKNPTSFIGIWDNFDGNVIANGNSMIRKGDFGTTDCGHKFTADGGGAPDVQANGLILQRVGDTVTVIGGGDGVSTTGSLNVTST